MLRLTILSGCFFVLCHACKAPAAAPKNTNETAPTAGVEYYVLDKNNYRVATQLDQKPLDDEGIKVLLRNLQYPKLARENLIQGTVVGAVYLDETGRIEKTEIIKNIGAKCGDEWMRVMTQHGPQVFKPAIEAGKTLRSKLIIPLNFRLE